MIEAGQSNRRVMDIRDTRTAYIDHGTGPALVMIHGVGLNASVWTPQIDEFDGEFRTIAYDTLGHGDSGPPPPEAALPDYLAQLRVLLDGLAIDRAILLGHSMGALIATLFAIEHGERVEGLIAANPVYRRSDTQLANARSRMRTLEERGPASSLDDVLLRWFGDPAGLKSARIEQVSQWLREADPQCYAKAYRVFSEADPWLDGRLRELSMPALFVTGGLDPNSTPDMARTMAAEAPLGRVEILERERHMMAYICPRRFNPVIGTFLRELSGSRKGSQIRAATRV